VTQALKAAGIGDEDMGPAREEAEDGAFDPALRYARRLLLRPYAVPAVAYARAGRDARQKAAAAMLRAGHGLDLVRRILDASPGDVPDPDSC
jgi:regulatory protein